MKTVKPKAKSKKNTARFGKDKFSNKESVENVSPDLSQLRKPIDISVSSLLEVTKLLETGGDEMKSILAYECDIVYECRVCRSLFRSLANFISHKRVYCREKFNLALCRKFRNDQIALKIGENFQITTEMLIPEKESKKNPNNRAEENNIRILRSQVMRTTLKKDLTSVVDMLQKKRSDDINENFLKPDSKFDKSELKTTNQAEIGIEGDKAIPQILLEAIDSTKSAVYQTATAPMSSIVQTADLMKAQMIELQNMVDQNTVILNLDGCPIDANQLEKGDNTLQIYGSDDEEGVNANSHDTRDLVCSVCNAKFSTRKTLTYHMKSLHVSWRKCYPCPCCNSTFANTWSVYRHLFKIHRKTNEQVRKLRGQIQEKAFRKEATAAEDIEKEKAMKESSSTTGLGTSNNTQEWIDHFELDLELQRCGGCGRKFDRRAALISHAAICQKRIAACNEASAATGNKLKGLSKTPSPNNIVDDSHSWSNEKTDRVVPSKAQTSKKQIPQKNEMQLIISPTEKIPEVSEKVLPEITNNSELSIRVENVSRISAADWDMIDSNSGESVSNRTLSPASDISFGKEQTSPANEQVRPIQIPDSPEIIFTSIDEDRTVAISFGTKKRRISLINKSKELPNGSNEKRENINSVQSVPSKDTRTISEDHMTIMQNRIAMIANLRKLQCLPCRRKFTSMTNLRRHMAVHIGWHRYRCRLCDFKCFVKCDCVAHCNKVHNAKNNRAIISDMVVQIPPDESALAKEIMMDISNSHASKSEPEIIDVSESSPNASDITEINSDSESIEPHWEKSSKRNKPVREDQAVSEKLDQEEEKLDLKEEKGPVVEKKPIKKLPDHGDEKLDSEGKESSVKEEKSPADEKSDQEAEKVNLETEKKFMEKEENEYVKKRSAEESANEEKQKLDRDADLRRMVMKVIFGTTEESDSAGGSDSAEIRDVMNSKVAIITEVPESPVNNKEIKESAVINESSKKRTSPIALKQLEDIKRQRPTRNRVKPVQEDFIYDLTELLRKESVVHRTSAIVAQKTLKKKQSNQQQQSAGIENEGGGVESSSEVNATEIQKISTPSKSQGSVSHKKLESNECNGRLSSSLRQLEVRLNSPIDITAGKNVVSTRISVSGQK